MTELEKYKYYFKYLSIQLGLKHWFHIDFKYQPNVKRNWVKDEIIGFEFKYLWKNLHEPVSFEEFCIPQDQIYSIKHWYMVVNNKVLC